MEKLSIFLRRDQCIPFPKLPSRPFLSFLTSWLHRALPPQDGRDVEWPVNIFAVLTTPLSRTARGGGKKGGKKKRAFKMTPLRFTLIRTNSSVHVTRAYCPLRVCVCARMTYVNLNLSKPHKFRRAKNPVEKKCVTHIGVFVARFVTEYYYNRTYTRQARLKVSS